MGTFFIEKNFNCTENSFNNNDKEIEMVNCETQIGFTTKYYHKVIFIILSSFGVILGLILFVDFIIYKIKKLKKKNKSSKTFGSMKLFFRILSILDFLSSLYWFLSSTMFSRVKDIKEKSFCKSLSFIYVILFIFNFYFISCTLRHFRKLNFDPINSIYKPRKSLINYLITGFVITIVATLLSLFLGILGKSPMNTCSINTELNPLSVLVYGIVLVLILIIFYQIIHGLYFSKMFINDNAMRTLYIQNSVYAGIYCGLHIPMIILFIITSIRNKNIVDSDISLKHFAYFSTILLYFTQSILGCLSIYQGMIKLNFCKKRKRRALDDLSDILNPNSSASLTMEDKYDLLDKHAMKSFMKNILLGIAISIKKSKEIQIPKKLGKNEFADSIKHEVNFKNYKLYGIDSYDVSSEEYLNVKIIDYAPSCFSFLRKMEGINIDDMINSFLPNNNKEGMKKSAGKSGSFFISTDDQEYMIKTLKKDELELIRHSFLHEYINYITENPNSLICRIYGMYSLIQYGGNETFIIVMRNVIGSLKNNIVAKFDLKGSTINREIKKLDMSTIDNGVMKDVNFNDIEFGIMVNNDNIKKINKIAQKDSKFLAKMELMDYSLFVVKLSLNKKELTSIFGEGIQEKIEKDYMDVLNDKTIMINNNDVSNLDNTLNTISSKNSVRINDDKFRYYKQYLFPGITIGTVYIISIIDFFQSYNFYKIVENTYKTKLKGKKSDAEGGISCVEPKLYSERFINYVKHLTEVKHILKGN